MNAFDPTYNGNKSLAPAGGGNFSNEKADGEDLFRAANNNAKKLRKKAFELMGLKG